MCNISLIISFLVVGGERVNFWITMSKCFGVLLLFAGCAFGQSDFMCPPNNKMGLCEQVPAPCFTDADCYEDQICCPHACSRTCKPKKHVSQARGGVSVVASHVPDLLNDPRVYVGRCPDSSCFAMFPEPDECSTSNLCPGEGQYCCNDGCKNVCLVKPEYAAIMAEREAKMKQQQLFMQQKQQEEMMRRQQEMYAQQQRQAALTEQSRLQAKARAAAEAELAAQQARAKYESEMKSKAEAEAAKLKQQMAQQQAAALLQQQSQATQAQQLAQQQAAALLQQQNQATQTQQQAQQQAAALLQQQNQATQIEQQAQQQAQQQAAALLQQQSQATQTLQQTQQQARLQAQQQAAALLQQQNQQAPPNPQMPTSSAGGFSFLDNFVDGPQTAGAAAAASEQPQAATAVGAPSKFSELAGNAFGSTAGLKSNGFAAQLNSLASVNPYSFAPQQNVYNKNDYAPGAASHVQDRLVSLILPQTPSPPRMAPEMSPAASYPRPGGYPYPQASRNQRRQEHVDPYLMYHFMQTAA